MNAQVSGSNHAPQYDNFDYSYAVMLNLNNGTTHDLQTGMMMNESKSVALNEGDVLIEGDKHAHYASITVNQDTFNHYFQSAAETKAAKIAAEIRSLESRLMTANYVQQLEDGLKQVHDALKHLEKTETVNRMLHEIEQMEKDYETFMIKVMDEVEPL